MKYFNIWKVANLEAEIVIMFFYNKIYHKNISM